MSQTLTNPHARCPAKKDFKRNQFGNDIGSFALSQTKLVGNPNTKKLKRKVFT